MSKRIVKIFFICIVSCMIISNIYEKCSAYSLGKITFKSEDENNSVITNLKVYIYQVATIDNNGNTIITKDFLESSIDINNLNDTKLDDLKEYALNNAEIFKTETTDSNGNFVISNIPLGIYLIVQGNYENYRMQTTIVKIPDSSYDNGLSYNITVKPKIVKLQNVENKNSKEEQIIKDKFLPRTGIVEWPIPVLVVLAIILFSIGWLKVYNNKKKVK